MPRRNLLSKADRDALLAMPTTQEDLVRLYSLSERDISVINQRRGDHNRLGFAVQLCYMRYPGIVLGITEEPHPSLLSFISSQLNIPTKAWDEYGDRPQTRREHLLEIQALFGFKLFSRGHYRSSIENLRDLAWQTDKGILLATSLIHILRSKSILLPSVNVIERICAEALTRATERLHHSLTDPLTRDHIEQLDALLDIKEGSAISSLVWLRQSPAAPNAKHVLEHIDRLKVINAISLPPGIELSVHRNRLMKLAREGGQMTSQHLHDFEGKRRYATLVAVVLEAKATIIDEIIDLHDRIIGALFNRAKRNHENQFQEAGKEINHKVNLFWKVGNALLEAKKSGSDPFTAIEAIIPWEAFVQSVTEAQKLARPDDFDYLHRIGDSYSQIRRYAPAFMETLHLSAAPAAKEILDAISLLKTLDTDNSRKVPENAPIGFVRKRWVPLVRREDGIDRRFYELCALSELKNALRSGDMWVRGSRQFKDFNEYLVPANDFETLRITGGLALSVVTDGEKYLRERIELLKHRLTEVNRLAEADQLPDVELTASGLKISPLINTVPETAGILMQRVYGLLPHVKITELLTEVDDWTGFSRHFTHLKSGKTAEDTRQLLTVILADAINLGLTKMAESCPGSSYSKLAWLQAWHIRDETYSAALAELVNAQSSQAFAKHWGDGTTSSSDGQRFRVGGRAEAGGSVNPKYGSEPGVQIYTHVSDQYAPFHSKVIRVGVRDATYVLDGLLYHESDLKIEEHYTDTAGFTDHVFALMHLLGFRFAPRIRDLADKRIIIPENSFQAPFLSALVGGSVNQKVILSHWNEILRLATSIKQGTVTASLMLRKLGSYPRQNGLAVALREIGRIERTFHTLDWLQDVEFRRHVTGELNKGEARNALARAVYFNRLGEMRDRNFEQQRYRASGLNLATAAIVLWNTVYIERAISALRQHGEEIDNNLLQYLSPLGWEHINLTGDYIWETAKKTEKGTFRPLRPF